MSVVVAPLHADIQRRDLLLALEEVFSIHHQMNATDLENYRGTVQHIFAFLTRSPYEVARDPAARAEAEAIARSVIQDDFDLPEQAWLDLAAKVVCDVMVIGVADANGDELPYDLEREIAREEAVRLALDNLPRPEWPRYGEAD